MEISNIPRHFAELTDDIQKYLHIQLEILKCHMTEVLAKVGVVLLQIFLFSLLAFFILFFLALGFVFWYGDNIGPLYVGALFVAGFYFLIGVIAYLLRKRLFINPLVSVFSGIIFDTDYDKEDYDDKE